MRVLGWLREGAWRVEGGGFGWLEGRGLWMVEGGCLDG